MACLPVRPSLSGLDLMAKQPMPEILPKSLNPHRLSSHTFCSASYAAASHLVVATTSLSERTQLATN